MWQFCTSEALTAQTHVIPETYIFSLVSAVSIFGALDKQDTPPPPTVRTGCFCTSFGVSKEQRQMALALTDTAAVAGQSNSNFWK